MVTVVLICILINVSLSYLSIKEILSYTVRVVVTVTCCDRLNDELNLFKSKTRKSRWID